MKTSRRHFLRTSAASAAASVTTGVSLFRGPAVRADGENAAMSACCLESVPSESDSAAIRPAKSAPLLCAVHETLETDGQIVVRPKDNGRALVNPGMGWVFHHYDNSLDGYGEPLGTDYDGRNFPGLSVVYLRLAWSFLEPEEGLFNWSILDSVIQRYRRMGIRYAFRLTAFEGNKASDGVPEWLREAGCPGFMVKPFSENEYWEVDYASPLFLEKLKRFLTAAGKRYARDPFLEFVDVGTLGIWGEGHPLGRRYSPEDLAVHFDLHKAAFPDTVIAANDDYLRHFKRPHSGDAGKEEIARLIDEKGLTLRDDSILVDAEPDPNYSAKYAERFWRTRPVILEMAHYSYVKDKGTWGGERYLRAIEDYHASYASIHAVPDEFLSENAAIIGRINRRLGYRLQMEEVRYPARLSTADRFEITSVWKNAGAAPCLCDIRPIWTLLNDNGDICAVFAEDAAALAGIMPNEERTVVSRFPVTPKLRSVCYNADTSACPAPSSDSLTNRDSSRLQDGKTRAESAYTLCVSLGTAAGTPEVALPYPSCPEAMAYRREFPAGRKNDVDALRYPIGKIRIETPTHSDPRP